MTTIANPIYDIVFKYLLEDDRITRTILSALLQKEVVDVVQRRNEYTNIARDGLSIFRIDFGATVREQDGSQHLVLIELQKTWLPTETLRFRQYLGAQYANKENMQSEGRGAYAIPMVTVYLLGHKVGDIEEPVLYVRRQSYDYDGRVVTQGLPNPFVDSLTHDSIIVQIPRLRVRPGNRLDRVLSVFDQTHQEGNNQQMLSLDESAYEDDAELLRIVHRLTAAAADSKVRHEMNVEDEYFSIIEDRDTELLQRNQELAEKKAELKEKSAELKEKSAELQEKSAELKEKSAELQEKSAELKEKSAELQEKSAELQEKSAELQEKSAKLQEKSAELQEKSAELQEKSAELQEKNAQLEEQSAQLEEQSAQLKMSVQALLNSGLSVDAVSKMLGMSIEKVHQLAE